MFVDNERDQAKTEWRTRMGIVADSRAADVNRWFDDQFGDLQGIAGNQAVQVYLQQIAELSADPTQADQIEGLKEYLRNIITVTADRAGLHRHHPDQCRCERDPAGFGRHPDRRREGQCARRLAQCAGL